MFSKFLHIVVVKIVLTINFVNEISIINFMDGKYLDDFLGLLVDWDSFEDKHYEFSRCPFCENKYVKTGWSTHLHFHPQISLSSDDLTLIINRAVQTRNNMQY